MCGRQGFVLTSTQLHASVMMQGTIALASEHFILEPELMFILESDLLFIADHIGNREETHLQVQKQQQKHGI